MSLDQVIRNQSRELSQTDVSKFEYEQKVCPTLLEMLALESHGGQKRRRSTVTFYVEGGRLGACVNDRHLGMNMHTSLESLEEAWDAIETALVSGVEKWRPSKRRQI